MTSTTEGGPALPPDPRKALGSLFDQHFDKLVRTLTKQTGIDENLALDIVQEVFKGYARTVAETGALPPGLAETTKSFAYVMSSLLNQFRDMHEKDVNQGRAGSDLLVPPEPPPSLDEVADRNQRRPLSLLARAETLDMIDEAIRTLDPAEQRLIEGVVDGRSLKDLAAELGLDFKNVYSHAARAWRKLSDSLGRYSSTFIHPADSWTYKPRTRRAALEALQTLPAPHPEYLFEKYALKISEPDMARFRDLPGPEIARRVHDAEALFAKKYGMKLPEELEAVLKNLQRI